MSKEIFTTANMNEIVTPIHEAMYEGNPVAKLVFGLNDAIRALKPGRPISKQERDNLEFMLDNILVGLANDSTGIGAYLADTKETFSKASFESILVDWYKAKQAMCKKDDKKNNDEKEGYSDKAKLVILDGLTNMLKTKGTKEISNIIQVDEKLIIDTICRNEGAEDKFFKALSPVGSIPCVMESDYAKDMEDEDDEEEGCGCCCGGGCEVPEGSDLSDIIEMILEKRKAKEKAEKSEKFHNDMKEIIATMAKEFDSTWSKILKNM